MAENHAKSKKVKHKNKSTSTDKYVHNSAVEIQGVKLHMYKGVYYICTSVQKADTDKTKDTQIHSDTYTHTHTHTHTHTQ